MNRSLKIVSLALMLPLFITSCIYKEVVEISDVDIIEDQDSITIAFINQIKLRSPTGEMDYYKIPDFTDYDAIPHDPNNPITEAKVILGMMLYHDPAAGTIPSNYKNYQTYSCGSCHPAECEYQPGIVQGIGEGGSGFGMFGEDRIANPDIPIADLDVQPLKTPSALNMAFAPNALWDGRLGARGFNEGTEELWTEKPQSTNLLGYDGLETQAIVGLTVHRISIDADWVVKYNYKELFDDAWPDINASKRYTDLYASLAIAAYERTMLSCSAPFQDFIRGDYSALTKAQILGGELFFGKGNCVACHTGVAFANNDKMFCIGLNDFDTTEAVRTSPQLGRASFTGNPEDSYKFKVPQLYNLKGVEHYGHGASQPSLRSMIEYCAKGDPENESVDPSFISPGFVDCNLTKTELDYIDDFLHNALYDAEIKRNSPDAVPSGFHFPNADEQSILDGL